MHPSLEALAKQAPQVGDRPWAWLEHWAAETPNAVAMTHPGGSWTYERYLYEVQRWSARIMETGARGEFIGVSAAKSPDLVAAMIGVLHSGNVLVPVDPGEPGDRLARIIEQTDPAVVYADDDALAGLDPALRAPFAFDSTERNPSAVERDDDDLVYVGYTSGSTGAPKGMSRTFAGVLQRTVEVLGVMQVRPDDVLIQAPELSFIATASRMLFGALMTGTKLTMIDPRQQSASAMLAEIAEQEVTIFHSPPQLFRALLAVCGPDDPRLRSLRLVRLGSDRTQPADLRAALRCLPDGCEFVIGYGSSDIGSISQTVFRRGDPIPQGRLPVGPPFPWFDIEIVDDDGKPLPQGEVGILEITNHLIAPSPFPAIGSVDPWPRRNGDTARILEDGSLDLVGRVAARIKIDGVPVDLNEVEARLGGHPLVELAVCVRHDRLDGRAELVAFVVTAGPLDESELRAVCSTLPSHSQPAHYRFVDSVPSTARGKVDRDALAELLAPEEGSGR